MNERLSDRALLDSVVLDGVVVVDKSAGMTSHDVVNRMRRIAGTRRVGHLGTLDPMATGVLPIVVGKATRLAQFLTTGEKKYDAAIRFGCSTDTYDREGEPTSERVAPSFTRAELEVALKKFEGTFPQVPPPISAKKIGGTPSYKLARRNIPVDLQPVEVTVWSIELRRFDLPLVEISVHCGGGTYIRSIAHDLGKFLGCGAMLETLRRTQSADFHIASARTLDELTWLSTEGRFREAVIPAARLLPEFPSEHVDDLTAGRIRQGRDFRVSPFHPRADARYVKAITHTGDLVAIGEVRMPHVYHPVLVF